MKPPGVRRRGSGEGLPEPPDEDGVPNLHRAAILTRGSPTPQWLKLETILGRCPAKPPLPPLEAAPERPANRRPLHDHESRPLQVLDESLGDDCRHEFVRVVDAFAT